MVSQPGVGCLDDKTPSRYVTYPWDELLSTPRQKSDDRPTGNPGSGGGVQRDGVGEGDTAILDGKVVAHTLCSCRQPELTQGRSRVER